MSTPIYPVSSKRSPAKCRSSITWASSTSSRTTRTAALVQHPTEITPDDLAPPDGSIDRGDVHSLRQHLGSGD